MPSPTSQDLELGLGVGADLNLPSLSSAPESFEIDFKSLSEK